MNKPLLGFATVIGLMMSVVYSYGSYQLLKSGQHLVAARPQIVLSADCPWAAMPPSIKEYISLNATNLTKLNKEDMLQLSEYYRDKAKNYKDPIALINQKDFPQAKKEGVKNER